MYAYQLTRARKEALRAIKKDLPEARWLVNVYNRLADEWNGTNIMYKPEVIIWELQ